MGHGRPLHGTLVSPSGETLQIPLDSWTPLCDPFGKYPLASNL